MNRGMRLLLVLMLAGWAGPALAQEKRDTSIICEVSLPYTDVKDSAGVYLTVTIKNITNGSIVAYKNLEEGYQDDKWTNFNLEIEKKERNDFKRYSQRSLYQRVPVFSDPPNGLKENIVDKIEKIPLSAGDSVLHKFHLDQVYKFEKGAYRMRCIYRNNILTDKKIYSNWIYFNVLNTIYTTRYYD